MIVENLISKMACFGGLNISAAPAFWRSLNFVVCHYYGAIISIIVDI
jgi:hypothetical protein